jgi:hypothetical protein
MGTWNTDSFGNDAADDWLLSMIAQDAPEHVIATLNWSVISEEERPRQSFVGQAKSKIYFSEEAVIAAAEVAAFWAGAGSTELANHSDWLTNHQKHHNSGLHQLAIQEIAKLMDESEIKELWDMPLPDGSVTTDPAWIASMQNLMDRLESSLEPINS